MAEMVHGSAVLAGAHGILIRGASGSGKSTLAATMLRAGSRLIADDCVFLAACQGRIVASAPANLAGKLELRGRGVVSQPYERSAVIRLVVDLLEPEQLERMPGEGDLATAILGVSLPRQPAPARSGVSAPLLDAALRALAAGVGLAARPTLGMIAPLPDMAVR